MAATGARHSAAFSELADEYGHRKLSAAVGESLDHCNK
jgi:hypothetical protein